jgi:hypothetical protein
MWLLRKLPILCVLSGAASAALPIGSVVMYSDGRVEKLMSHGNGELLWEDDRKRQFLRSDNPIMPLLRRTDFLSGKGYSQSVAEGDPDSIKQLPSGVQVGFTVIRTKHSGERSTRNWNCKHVGKRQEKVLGVIRELDSFSCERFVFQRKTWQKNFRESRQFSYSHDLGLVVKMQRKTRKKSRGWKLVSIVPPDQTSYKRLSREVRKLRAAK